ncbi:hypothetical protein PROFUN_05115 [Planoprotostelium fungivorum]|uniref:Major facilitator superfamily (MFS) profile domain-containing protein n=1 Tax=Planoprotostelium fungivorum TaxID=1890364 RepID=A0A2P6NRQ2_9EUKA|nr:hypothetical protein PROFUN_05115 [Planoprotostelium fungivorum]
MSETKLRRDVVPLDDNDVDDQQKDDAVEEGVTITDEGGVDDLTLDQLDSAKLSWWHIRAVLVAGIGFFTDAYDLFVINMCVPMIKYVYFDNHLPAVDEGFMKGTAVFGTLVGQLLFGIIADHKGRSGVYGIELMLIIMGTIGATMAASPVRGMNIAAMISIWRLVVGIGIGGDYPLSATITSEFSTKGRRGTLMAAVFSMQGLGQLAGGLVSLMMLGIFKHSIQNDPYMLDYVWRFIMGLGVIPAVATLYFRLTMPESPRYQKEKATLEQQKDELNSSGHPSGPKKSGLREFLDHFGQWKHGKVLLGTSLSWFLLDISYYGLTLNQSTIISSIGFAQKFPGDPYSTMLSLAQGNTLVTLMGLLPGYYFSVALIDRWGRKPIQILGFVMLTILMALISAFYFQLKQNHLWLFVLLYSLALFFFNFGPNVTTFIIPGEVFPTRYRSTGHGISAAAGKAGAIIATYLFPEIVSVWPENGIQIIMGIFAFVMAAGLGVTFLVPETKGRSLEEISEDVNVIETDRSKREKPGKEKLLGPNEEV